MPFQLMQSKPFKFTYSFPFHICKIKRKWLSLYYENVVTVNQEKPCMWQPSWGASWDLTTLFGTAIILCSCLGWGCLGVRSNENCRKVPSLPLVLVRTWVLARGWIILQRTVQPHVTIEERLRGLLDRGLFTSCMSSGKRLAPLMFSCIS